MTIGCVPMSSPLLNRTGQNLITDSEVAVNDGRLVGDVKKDLFDYGTLAKICGIEGKGTGEMSLLVEGVARFRVERLTQFEPCVQAEVSYYDDDGMVLGLAYPPWLTLRTLNLLIHHSDPTFRHHRPRLIRASQAALSTVADFAKAFVSSSARWGNGALASRPATPGIIHRQERPRSGRPARGLHVKYGRYVS